MSAQLAVISPYLGRTSNTFVDRHARQLAPGNSVGVATVAVEGAWNAGNAAPPPTLELDSVGTSLPTRILRGLQRRAGLPLADARLAALEEFLGEHRVEAVLVEYLNWGWELRDLKRRLGVRYFAHAHGHDVSILLRDPEWRRRYLELNGIDGLVAMSEDCRRRLVGIGIDEERVHVIPYGVDPVGAIERPSHAQVRCLAVGRMVGKKAPILLLDAFRRAREQVPGLHLDYIGEGELFAAARQFVEALELGEAVTLHGEQPHAVVLERLHQADVFLQHSVVDSVSGDEEGLPVAILEAMAHGLPVVSTRHAGIPEAVVDGETGLLVDEGDVGGMAEALVALAGSPERRAQLGAAGAARIAERFTWERERTDLRALLGLRD